MAGNWLRIGSVAINADRIIAINLDKEWPEVLKWKKEPRGGASPGLSGSRKGVEIILDVSDTSLQTADLFPALFKEINETRGLLVLRFPDGSPETQAVRDFFDAAPAKP
jgi:hypothetical protein